MKRRTTMLVASTAIFIAFASGCAGLSTVREELALREMAKRSYAKCNHNRPSGLYSRDFERGWRQAYYNVSRGFDPCPPSVPPEAYWSTKYQNAQGCKSIAAWYQGYNAGATAASSECRSGFSKVPVVASCVRHEATECVPVQPLRHPVLDAFVFDETQFEETSLTATTDRLDNARDISPSRAEIDAFAETKKRTDDQSPQVDEVDREVEAEIIRTSFRGPVRLPTVE